MNRLVRKFGKYDVATFIIMGVGVILFLFTPLLLWLLDFDSDILGLLVFLIGLVTWVAGFVIRKVRGNRRVG
jgi:predicted membrane channel-forming protein YqfA (hemolysin III family)